MTGRLEISFHVQTPQWKSRLRPYTKTVRQVLELAAREVGLKAVKNPKEISVVFADDEFVRELNGNYRGKDKPTNILSFPASSPTADRRSPTAELGDLILAFETVEREAKEQGKVFRSHAIHLLVHGFLHLLGYDHLEDKDADEMECLEIKILKKLGINNPYL